MNTLLIILILGLIIIIVLGFVTYFVSKSIFTPPAAKPPSLICGINKECPEGFFCSATGFCVKKNSCLLDADCAEDKVCIKGQCGNSVCSGNEDCLSGSYCDNGKCVAFCDTGSDCPGSQTCVNKKCTAKKCLSVLDCDVNEVCTTDKAFFIGDPLKPTLVTPLEKADVGVCLKAFTPCFTDLDCPKPLTCSNGVCVQCKNTLFCENSKICSSGVCVPPLQASLCPVGYTKTNSCLPGKGCTNYVQCCPSSCGLKPCSKTSDCTGACPYCVGGVCVCNPAPSLPTPNTCTSNKDCLSGLMCYDSACSKDLRCPTLDNTYHCVTTEPYNRPFLTITCPSNRKDKYCDLRTNCCGTSLEGSKCETSTFCGNNLFCVNQHCSASKGSYGDRCVENRDCENGFICNINKINPICEPQ